MNSESLCQTFQSEERLKWDTRTWNENPFWTAFNPQQPQPQVDDGDEPSRCRSVGSRFIYLMRLHSHHGAHASGTAEPRDEEVRKMGAEGIKKGFGQSDRD